METKETVVARFVEPKGDILNDNDSGIDYLGNSIYAEALARRIEHVNTPVTIGLFAGWGSGKTFLVNHVQNLLRKYQRQQETFDKISEPHRNCWRSRCFCRTIVLIVLVAVIVTSIIWALFPDIFLVWIPKEESTIIALNESLSNHKNSSKYYYIYHVENTDNDVINDEELTRYENWRNFSRYFAIAILCLGMVFVFVVICGNTNYWSKAFFSNFRLVCYVAFTKIPIKATRSSVVKENLEEDQVLEMTSCSEEIEETNLKPIRYIFVNFNAWQYAGSDSLWAGIVTNLSDAIEDEFGTVTSRIFRMLQPELISRDVKTKEFNSTVLFAKIKIGGDLSRNEALDIFKTFGVVNYFKEYRTWREDSKKTRHNLNESSGWFVVEYSSHKEAKHAKESLELEGVMVRLADPFKNLKTPQNGKDRNENHIEMDDFNKKPTAKLIKKDKLPPPKHTADGFVNHFIRHPKTTCLFPVLFWLVMLMFVCISFPVVTYVLANQLNLKVFSQYPRAIPVAVQIFAWLPSTIAVSVVMMKFVWAMCHSQRDRINSALDGAKGSMGNGLGFMDDVKTEVEVMSMLIRCVEFSHNKKYKVVITIDDLDRLASDKVISVLQAVSILLSDRSSPFICLVALDSRVAVKCIEQEMSESLLKANVNGHEYLKKIINLPFCLPEVNTRNKKVFVTGLIDQSDKIKKIRIPKPSTNHVDVDRPSTNVDQQRRASNHPLSRRNSVLNESRRNSVVKETDLSDIAMILGDPKKKVVSEKEIGFDTVDAGPFKPPDNDENIHKRKRRQNPLSNETFIFECRKFMLENEIVMGHLVGNPRNMKRIFNVLSLTATIINCCANEKLRERNIKSMMDSNRYEEVNELSSGSKQQNVEVNYEDEVNIRNVGFAEDLVTWVVLTDQWPYRMSYVLQIIDDVEQRSKSGWDGKISDHETLFRIYQKFVLPEIEKIKKVDDDGHKSLMYLDSNPDIFYNFLHELSNHAPHINKSRVELLKKYTINLDHSLKQSIALQRDGIDMSDISKNGNCDSKSAKNTSSLKRPYDENQLLTVPNEIGNFHIEKKCKKAQIPKRIERRKHLSNVSFSKSHGVVAYIGDMPCDNV